MIIHFPVRRGTTREFRSQEDDPSHFGGGRQRCIR
jgi:hypothetical protein